MKKGKIIRFRIKRSLRRSRVLVHAFFYNLRHNGIRITAQKTARTLGIGGNVTLRQWTRVPLYSKKQLEEQREHRFERDIKFSIITPLYNTSESFLREMIESVLAQTYANWELCMADGSDDRHEYIQQICASYAQRDQRIRYRKLKGNRGIAGNYNACIDMAEGDYISILDHDDILHPAALYDVMKAICRENADFIYTDEATFQSPDLYDVLFIHFKPDYAPDNLKANNYICHFTSVKRSLLDQCGHFREGYDGSQDHELFLRLTDKAKNIVHIPKELYYWRAHEESTAASEYNKPYAGEAGKKAVRDFLKQKGYAVSVTNAQGIPTIYRVSYEIQKPEPLISIIIPNYEHVDDLRTCISSIYSKTTYSNYEIIIVENNSTSPKIFQYYQELTDGHDNIKVIYWPGKGFNWAALNNYAVREASRGDYLLLLNNDIEVITPDWLQEMLMHAQRPDVGVVGVMLYYPDDRIQHAGTIMGSECRCAYAFQNKQRGELGYMGRLCYAQNLSVLMGACMMIRKEVYEEVGGVDEEFAVGYNDVDLCMRIRTAGYVNVWTPYAELYHYESKSRGIADTPEKKAQGEYEKQLLIAKWGRERQKGDPYYNPNLSMNEAHFELSQEELERRKSQSEKMKRRHSQEVPLESIGNRCWRSAGP